ncbi:MULTISPECIES: c-type cytochrome [Maribacter]|uniref:C-type cytochrome n=1 Tax=Maribacter flavus TaxID=1658664 RepID=A0ABU7IGR7_9FLAO|nr:MULTISPECIES: c-type cytochrome [Maribacter]MDC6404730.1 diheme cytochrome c-553 [Maribacter sp. PR66]MEE1972144.1 c-type cytochrome [Maribacter flavus]
MKNKLIAIMTFSVLILASCNRPKEKKVAVIEEANVKTVNLEERGEYLVSIIGCADCHTPKKMTAMGPVPDMDRYMMGFDSSGALPPIPENVPLGPWALFAGDLTAAVGPWGTSYAGNLTPHETGIGSWTLDQFKKAIKEGKYKGLDGSRPIMPPMPVEAYRSMNDEDVEAIFAYLKSLKPIENVVPVYIPPTS